MKNDAPAKRATRDARSMEVRRMPLQSRGHKTIEAILTVASRQLDRDGLERLTTRRIASEAGVSVGALYEYFPNKESIILALAEHWLNRVYEAVESAHPSRGATGDVLSFLNRAIEGIVPLYRDQPGLPAINAALGSSPDLRHASEDHNRRIISLLSDALAQLAPNAPADEIDTVARTFHIIGHEMVSEAYLRRSPYPEKLLESLKVCLFALASRLLLPVAHPGPKRSSATDTPA